MNSAELLAAVRTKLSVEATDPSLPLLYERFLKHETLTAREAMALAVGVDPANIPADCIEFEALVESLATYAGSKDRVNVGRLLRWADAQPLRVPQPLIDLYSFITKTVLPAPATNDGPGFMGALGPAVPGEQSDDMTTLLGAALCIVANFNADARNEQGVVDPACIARVLTEKSVRWFGERPCPYAEPEITRILDRWLS